MSDALDRLAHARVLAPLDLQFARTLGRLCRGQSEAVLLGAAFASRAVAAGHVCADLKTLGARPLLDADGEPVAEVELPAPFSWVMELGGSPLVGDGDGPAPLVLDEAARLYLTRYWRYQRVLATRLAERATTLADDLDPSGLQASLSRLFAASDAVRSDPRQRLAALVAGLRRLAVISGGPGTGKTTTVVRILAALQEQALAANKPPLRVELLAPTGKAAARLGESIQRGKADLATTGDVKDSISDEASTIHRRLGYRPPTPTRFFHDADNPLPADVVLVDEASMVDLALMAKLVDAVPPRARLILLGDKDQLASVEAGAILGDICNTGQRHAYSRGFAVTVRELLGEDAPALAVGPDDTGVWDCIVELTKSYRFDADSGIGALARAVGRGEAEHAVGLLEAAPEDAAAQMVSLTDPGQIEGTLRDRIISAFGPFVRAAEPAERLRRLGDFRLLCAHRRGPFGAQQLNALAERVLARAGLVDPAAEHYHGRPIMVTQNDYQLELFNGDVGVIQRETGGRVRAWFAGRQGELRALSPARLPPHESVYAMTVHKSQGSEFDEVALIVPPQVSPILTRELVYTGVTRAKRRVTLYGSPRVLADAIHHRIERASGLRDALWPSPTQWRPRRKVSAHR